MPNENTNEGAPAPIPSTPPPSTPPAEAAPPAESTPPAQFDFQKTMLEGLGLAVGTPPEPTPLPDPHLSTVGRTLGETLAVIDEEREAAKTAPPEDPKSQTDKGLTPAAKTEPEKPKPVVVEKRPSIESIVTDSVKKVLAEQKAALPLPPAPVAQPAAPTVDPFESELTEAEREELDFAKFAAKANPALAAYPTQTLEFYKKVKAYVEKEGDKDTDRTFDESDEAFMRFLKQNKPTISPVERRKIETARIREQVLEDVKKENDGRLSEIQRRQHMLEIGPKIERGVQEFAQGVQQFIASDEKSMAAPVLKRAAEAGWETAIKEDPIFAPIVHGVTQKSTELATQYLALTASVQPFDPQNQDHTWLLTFVRRQCDSFAKDGGDAKIRNGKSFLTMAEFNDLRQKDPNRAAQHWTFSDRDILERLANNAKLHVEKVLKTESERLVNAGYERRKAAPAAPAVPGKASQPQPAQSAKPPEQRAASPRATSGSSPGAVVPTNGKPVDPVFAALGLA